MEKLLRTFIAIEIPTEIQKILGQIQLQLKDTGADIKWVQPSHIHLTLKFLGEIPENKVPIVTKTLEKIIPSFSRFSIELKQLGAFPRIDQPKIIWIGIEKGRDETIKLANTLEEALFQEGFPKEERSFSPHLTLGRQRSTTHADKISKKIKDFQAHQELTPVIHSVVLFQSTLTPQGPIYSPLAKIFLKS